VGRYKEISDALQVLGLCGPATIKEIKKRYRQLLKEWHPDLSSTDQKNRKEKTAEIVVAYKKLIAYCEEYRFSFNREEIEKYISPEEMWEKQFGRDPIWGNFKDDEDE
jgi:curved DNA-binding protein CbpA